MTLILIWVVELAQPKNLEKEHQLLTLFFTDVGV